MAVKEVLIHPDERLLTKSEPIYHTLIEAADEHLIRRMKELIQDLTDTMRDHDGVGLAATQIGSSLRVFVYEDKDGTVQGVINPRIMFKKGKVRSYDEGCLSCPDVRVNIRRARHIKIGCFSIVDDELMLTIISADKADAIKIQHEIDHLNGITIMERADAKERNKSDNAKR